MHPVWAQRREEVLRDRLVSPNVFTQTVDRLDEFVVPYQHVLATEAGQRNVHLYLQGLLSRVSGKNAEDIATFVSVECQVIQPMFAGLLEAGAGGGWRSGPRNSRRHWWAIGAVCAS